MAEDSYNIIFLFVVTLENFNSPFTVVLVVVIPLLFTVILSIPPVTIAKLSSPFLYIPVFRSFENAIDGRS